MAVDFPMWLCEPSSIRCMLVDVYASVGGVETLFHLSTHPYDDGSSSYDASLDPKAISIEESLALENLSSSTVGTVEIVNNDGLFDNWINYVWANRSIKLYIGDPSWIKADFQLVFDGVLENIVFNEEEVISFRLRSKLERINFPIQQTKLGGVTQNKDKLLPLCFGECFNVEPLLVDPALLKYKVHTGAIEDIIEVRDNGVPVSITKDTANGEFTLTNQPFGKITASVQGAKPSTWLIKTGEIIKHIVMNYGGPNKLVLGDIDSSNLTTYDSNNPQALGVYIGERENIIDICEGLATSTGASVVINRLGLLKLLKIQIPAAGSSTELNEHTILSGSLKIIDTLEVKSATKVNYCKNWAPQPGLVTNIPATSKDLFEKPYHTIEVSDAAVESAYRITKESPVVETFLLTEANAQTEAQRLLDLYKTPRYIVGLEATPEMFLLNIGDRVVLKYPRYDLGAGKEGIILKAVYDLTTLTPYFEVLI